MLTHLKIANQSSSKKVTVIVGVGRELERESLPRVCPHDSRGDEVTYYRTMDGARMVGPLVLGQSEPRPRLDTEQQESHCQSSTNNCEQTIVVIVFGIEF